MGAVLSKIPHQSGGFACSVIRGYLFSRKICLALFAAAILAVICGCTDIERRGYSPIPQNSSPSWSSNPYGDIRN